MSSIINFCARRPIQADLVKHVILLGQFVQELAPVAFWEREVGYAQCNDNNEYIYSALHLNVIGF